MEKLPLWETGGFGHGGFSVRLSGTEKRLFPIAGCFAVRERLPAMKSCRRAVGRASGAKAVENTIHELAVLILNLENALDLGTYVLWEA